MKPFLSLSVLLILSSVFISCDDDVTGCTNPVATNYDELATSEDGSCILNSNTLLGVWNINTVEHGLVIDETLINNYKIQLGSLGAAWFESYYQTQVPGNEESWINFVSDQTTWIDTLSYSQYEFEPWHITAPNISSFDTIRYVVLNENKLVFYEGSIGNYTSFDISYLTESDFVLSSVFFEEETNLNKTIDIHMSR